jgi:hypothetical protein
MQDVLETSGTLYMRQNFLAKNSLLNRYSSNLLSVAYIVVKDNQSK